MSSAPVRSMASRVREAVQLEQVAPAPVARERGVRDPDVRVDVQQRLLVDALQRVPEPHDHRLVGEHPEALAVVPVAQVVEQAAHPEHHVGPALPAGRLVVELAEPLATGGLLGVPGADPETRQPVEDAEVPLAQPLVEEHLLAAAPHRQRRRLGGTPVRRAQHDGGPPGLVRAGQPRGQRVGLVPAGRRELDVGVAHVEVELLRVRRARRVVGLVADALAVTDEGDLLRTGGPSRSDHGRGVPARARINRPLPSGWPSAGGSAACRLPMRVPGDHARHHRRSHRRRLRPRGRREPDRVRRQPGHLRGRHGRLGAAARSSGRAPDRYASATS